MKLTGLYLIEVSGDGCANCVAMSPVLKEVAAKFGLSFASFGGAEVAEYALKIDKTPAVILADGGKQFAVCYGYQPREILELWIEAKLEKHVKEK